MAAVTGRAVTITFTPMRLARVDSKCCVVPTTLRSPRARHPNALPHDGPPRLPPKLRSEPWRFGMAMGG
jgi:hypothetical protein